jgi:hypothetical protein
MIKVLELQAELQKLIQAHVLNGGDARDMAITGRRCFVCNRITWNPTDVKEGYCGHCHDWTKGETVIKEDDQSAGQMLPPEIWPGSKA